MKKRPGIASDVGYVRDARSPTPSSEAASRVMSANRAKDTDPELTLRRTLRAAGLTGYRLHAKGVPGRPDIAFVGRRLAIFVHGCFWHACPTCRFPTPRSNTAFWTEKFARNRARDGRKVAELEAAGWRVLVFWEHEVRDELASVVETVASAWAQA